MGSATSFKGGGILSKNAGIILIDEGHAESLRRSLQLAGIEINEIDAFNLNGTPTKLFALPPGAKIEAVAKAVREFKPE